MEGQLTKTELANWIQYWFSKYCNCEIRSERELYFEAYKSLKEIYDLWLKENKFPKEGNKNNEILQNLLHREVT